MPLTGLSLYLHVCTTNGTFFLGRIRYTCVANFLFFSPGCPGCVTVPDGGGPRPDPAGEAGDLLGGGRPAAAAAVALVPGDGGGSAAPIRVEDVLQGDLRTKKEKNA